MRHILFPNNPATSNGADGLGGKAGALASLAAAKLPIPAWFAISPEACGQSCEEEIRQALAALCPAGERVAVRSSAVDEDGAEHSFAGQLESFLFVAAEDVPRQVAAVWRSGFSDRILAYRRENGLDPEPRPPAVLVQRMVNADVAGVAFSADPVSGRRGMAVVSAVYGLGDTLVSGESDADTWQVDRGGVIRDRRIAAKRIAHRFDPRSAEGMAVVPVDAAEAERPSLTDEQIRAVAELARQTARHFKRPQDIEWAIEGGRLYLLQSRPITTLPGLADPDGLLNLWDNSNIAESYGGVTTPLTFSFALRAYEEVYRQFCRMMYVPEPDIVRSDQTFRHMLGLIRGRIYYNLINWYRVLALLPGFKVNRKFMEQMMGVKEGMPERLLAEFERPTFRDKLRDALNLCVTACGLIVNHFRLPRRIDEFYARLNQALDETDVPLAEMRADELAAYYRRLEARLLTRWDAPLINDFFAMIFFGVLRKQVEKWCGDADGTLQNNLLVGEGGIISAEPARRIREMARIVQGDEPLIDALCDGSHEEILPHIERRADFRAEYESYLAKFGDRCLDELKLESATLHDDPLLMLRSVGQLARRLGVVAGGFADNVETELRAAAERQAAAALSGHPLRRGVFNRVKRHARARVRERENLRFERTRLFGRVRRIFVEIGERFFAANLLKHPRDIFYLEVEEALGFIEGTASTTDLAGLAAVRQAEFERHRSAPSPADRFETFGIVSQGNRYEPVSGAAIAEEADPQSRKGLGCCPGIVRGRVRVVTDPRHAALEHGEILVAERTDPGWIMLFPSAAGLLVERGSLLSHSAIVARELGIPAIVSIAGVTQWLSTGDEVELNGTTGVIRKLGKVGHE
ncbi:MAG: PEP/pyruvate-binding domain-containing protein [Blastocatellia bacterium]